MKLKSLEQRYEEDVKSIRQQMGSIIMTLEKLRDQDDINTIASTLYKSGQLKISQVYDGEPVEYAVQESASQRS